uniref:Uncharacterized protein n=1 Tax=Prasinoderma coloniale TaxID=156133 RepID=A0A7R9XV51_9VIRI|eukprot:PRCOL_00003617-RA
MVKAALKAQALAAAINAGFAGDQIDQLLDGPARRRERGRRGVYFEIVDLHVFPGLPTPYARLALATLALAITLLSMLSGVLLGDYLFERRFGLPSDVARRACWHAAASCVGTIVTVGGIVYHFYGANAGELSGELGARDRRDIEALDRTL